MIVSIKGDTVSLSGALVKNQWLTIKAAAGLLLRDHAEGIVIDCSELTHVSEDGARTFMDALAYIESAGARIVVCAIPPAVMQVIRTVPGVRSQLPIAATVDEARASLHQGAQTGSDVPSGGVLVFVMDGIDIDLALALAAQASRGRNLPVSVVYPMSVARNLPIGTPLPELESAAQARMTVARQAATRNGVQVNCHITRVRDVVEGMLHAITDHTAEVAVFCLDKRRSEEEDLSEVAQTLLRRAGCLVLIGRRAAEATPGHETGRPSSAAH